MQINEIECFPEPNCSEKQEAYSVFVLKFSRKKRRDSMAMADFERIEEQLKVKIGEFLFLFPVLFYLKAKRKNLQEKLLKILENDRCYEIDVSEIPQQEVRLRWKGKGTRKKPVNENSIPRLPDSIRTTSERSE